jgi:hypothetical protein
MTSRSIIELDQTRRVGAFNETRSSLSIDMAIETIVTLGVPTRRSKEEEGTLSDIRHYPGLIRVC